MLFRSEKANTGFWAAKEPPSLRRRHPGLTPGLPHLTLAPHVHQHRQSPPFPLAYCREGGIGCERLRGAGGPQSHRQVSLAPRGSHPEHARCTASQAGGYSQRPEQQMANHVEMPQQQEKGPQGVFVEARDPKGSSPRDPRATPSYSSLLCREGCKAPRGTMFCTRQTTKPWEPVIPSDHIPQGQERSLLTSGAGCRLSRLTRPSGAAGRQQGKASLSVPAAAAGSAGHTTPARARC